MRKDRGWSQQQGFEALRDGLHLGPKSRASYVAVDMGKRKPTSEEARFLVSFFGQSPEDIPDNQDPIETPDAIAAVLTAVSSLIEEMRLTRIQQNESTEALLTALGAFVSGRDSDDTRRALR